MAFIEIINSVLRFLVVNIDQYIYIYIYRYIILLVNFMLLAYSLNSKYGIVKSIIGA